MKPLHSRLRHRVLLQQEVLTDDDSGGFTRSWQDVATLWAEVLPLEGAERFVAGQVAEMAAYRVRLRRREGVDGRMRLMMDEKLFHVALVQPYGEEPGMLELVVREGVAA